VPSTTVVIPTYRRPARLVRAVCSALAQTHADLEVWVYDNASGDETEAVVRRLAGADDRLHYHRHEQNVGAFANFRYAIEHVRTPFFSILADDDLLLPDFHRLALLTFSSAPELVMVGLDCIHCEEGGALLRRREIGPGTYRAPEGMVEMLRRGHPNWTSVLFRREVLDLIGGLDPAAGIYLDLDVLLRTAASAAFAVRPEPGAVYFYHDGASSSSSSTDAGRWSAFASIVDRIAADDSMSAQLREEAVLHLRRMFRAMLVKAGVGAARRGNRAAAAATARELRARLHDVPAAAGVRLAAFAAPLPGGKQVLERLARSRRPYTGERLADRLSADLTRVEVDLLLQPVGSDGPRAGEDLARDRA
jgi:glycosyltransferase involved in cell wall biosynthesis